MLAVANLADALCKKVMVGCFSKFRGGTLSVPEKKTRTSSMLQSVNFSSAKNEKIYNDTSLYPCHWILVEVGQIEVK